MSSFAVHPCLDTPLLMSQGFGNDFQQPNPFASSNPTTAALPPKKGGMPTWLWVLLIVGGILLLLVLGCVGLCGGSMYFGLNVLNDGVKKSFENDPVVQQHLGGLSTVSVNLMATGEEQQKRQAAGQREAMVFDVTGPKGKGQIICEQDKSKGDRFRNGILRLSTGEEFKLSN